MDIGKNLLLKQPVASILNAGRPALSSADALQAEGSHDDSFADHMTRLRDAPQAPSAAEGRNPVAENRSAAAEHTARQSDPEPRRETRTQAGKASYREANAARERETDTDRRTSEKSARRRPAVEHGANDATGTASVQPTGAPGGGETLPTPGKDSSVTAADVPSTENPGVTPPVLADGADSPDPLAPDGEAVQTEPAFSLQAVATGTAVATAASPVAVAGGDQAADGGFGDAAPVSSDNQVSTATIEGASPASASATDSMPPLPADALANSVQSAGGVERLVADSVSDTAVKTPEVPTVLTPFPTPASPATTPMVLPNGSASAPTATPVFSLHTPMMDPGWDQDLGARLQWLVHQGVHSAELRLNPPDLGAMDVRITSDGASSNVQFFAASSAVRDALEAALPRLRDLFLQQGLQLDGAGVSDRPLADRRSGEDPGFRGQSSPRGYAVRPDDGGDGEVDAARWVRSRVGLVDYYI